MRSGQPEQQGVRVSRPSDLEAVRYQQPPQVGQRVPPVSAYRHVVGAPHPLICRLTNKQQAARPQHAMHFGDGGAGSLIIELIDHVEARNKIKLPLAKWQPVGGRERSRVKITGSPERRRVRRQIDSVDFAES